MDSFRIILEILKKICDILLKVDSSNTFGFIRNQVSMLAKAIPGNWIWIITNENIIDIQFEISRLNYMVRDKIPKFLK